MRRTTREDIFYDRSTDRLVCPTLSLSSDSIADLRRQIAAYNKEAKAKARPVKVIFFEPWAITHGKMKYGIARAKSGNTRHWVTSGGKRQVVPDDNIYIDSPRMRKRIAALCKREKSLDKAIVVLEHQWKSLESLETVEVFARLDEKRATIDGLTAALNAPGGKE
jgi:hypothetical protein